MTPPPPSKPGPPSKVAPDRPVNLAIICNSLPPYRVHFHRRIVRELPNVKLWSVCTHETTQGRWRFAPPPEIRAISFGQGQPAESQSHPAQFLSEWTKGGRVIDWLTRTRIGCVITLGYSDPGRLRIITWCRRHAIPCFLWGDSNIKDDTRTGPVAALKKLLLPRIVSACTGVMPCGSLGRAYYQKYGAAPDNIFLCPYEPDYDQIRKTPIEGINAVREHYNLTDSRRRFIYSGRLVSVKRVDLLVEAFINIADQRPQWDLVLLGDGVLRASLSAKIPEPLRQRVKWIGFQDDQATVNALYKLCDVLVLPSDFEPWALVINEAVAAGLAVVSSSVVGAAEELVRDDVNGRIFPPGNLRDLEQCLLDTSEPSRLEAMRQASASVLKDWQDKADPVRGLTQALTHVGLL